MRIKICRVGMNETVAFALDELRRYLYLIDKTIDVEPFYYDEYRASNTDAIWLVADPSLAPEVEDPSIDDAFRISVKDNGGIIAGTNPMSVLIAVYSLLKKLGCTWIRPGRDGEIIEEKVLEPLNFEYEEKADYRFRGINLDCKASTQTAIDMIDWMPKEGMNNYFVESMNPEKYFKGFCRYKDLELADWQAAFNMVALEAKKRGLKRHAVGHGWHMSAIGHNDQTSVASLSAKDFTEEQLSYLAMMNGKRDLYLGHNLFGTHLCYSKDFLRERMLNAIVDYLKENKGVDYLHFWLADGCNNHCECEDCQKHRPADWYVMMLNDLDRKLKAEGITSRIVCLIYVDLLWEPLEFSVENPDRFILMFAPITRTYDTSYSDFDTTGVEKTPYVRNKLIWPRSAAENVVYLRDWQEKQLKGDSFLFDYHLMWNQYKEPGYRNLSRVIYEDMFNLKNLGLGGSVSCEVYNCQIPHDFPHRIMARTLWNRNVDYYKEEKECFKETYGEDFELAFDYLDRVSNTFSLIYRYYTEGEKTRDEQKAFADNVEKLVCDFKPVIDKNILKSLPTAQHISWELLSYHADYILAYAKAYCAKYQGDVEASDKYIEEFNAICDTIHEHFEEYFSIYFSKFSVKYYCDEITEHGANVVLL